MYQAASRSKNAQLIAIWNFSLFLGRGATSIRRFWVYASSFHLQLGQSAWIWLAQCGHPHLWLVKRGTIWLSNFITGREFGSQKFLPNMNLALKSSYRIRIWLCNIITRHLTNKNKNLNKVKNYDLVHGSCFIYDCRRFSKNSQGTVFER